MNAMLNRPLDVFLCCYILDLCRFVSVSAFCRSCIYGFFCSIALYGALAALEVGMMQYIPVGYLPDSSFIWSYYYIYFVTQLVPPTVSSRVAGEA